MKKKEKIDLPESIANINNDQPIYFEKNSSSLKVFEVVNNILGPYGYEEVSAGQFKRIAGSSANSSNKIENFAIGRGSIAHGFTHLPNIIEYCQSIIDNSILVPLEEVIKEFNWAKKAINENFITLHSNGKMRYDIEAIMDITKGMLNEVAFKMDCESYGIDIELNRDFYKGTSNTDEGQDVKRVRFNKNKFAEPKVKVQIKDVQYFLLIPKNEFGGDRQAGLFVGYRVHWKKANTGQRFFRSLGGRGEEIFSDFPVLGGIRVERRGWALRSDFQSLPAGTASKGMKFNNDNMFVYWDNLRNMEELFPKLSDLI
ncbi:MAG: hypothetical protein COV31_01165 [Candidatus Yanofskybacteria bacterium CG10_big_fil_rev_8_21_14_0_10_46_23]|uniref:Restriction endonuclease n=1 Tax=Candidatus Yanofskybacteria bacterium CG10_big_fil_rev_8_21_14_0_10_46_23 TaxID=1975098 RepID=A0A2H0R4M9_9BACT|nr:MAG: hypothetical protein COV31_01165 [Candidatus Yanofskybacteria bacterium CG10_big_fil_rev_8_21_14_0_10_46_23]